MKNKMNSFSVGLGLLDYINPLFYTITSIQIINNLNLGVIYKIGVIVSLIFGFVIPTGKLIVGLGIIKFVMPVILVFLVNSGIFICGLILSRYVFNYNNYLFIFIILVSLICLLLIYFKTKKFNTIAVLLGAVGYLLIYCSLITLSIQSQYLIPIILYGVAICLFIFLCGIGIKADLMNPKVHWVIEISNVLCQGLIAFGTILLFR